MAIRLSLALAALSVAAGCHDPRSAEPSGGSAACSCTPGNRSRVRQADGSVLDGAALITRLRRHRGDVEQHRTPRDIKVADDQLRFDIANFCDPCGSWVADRMTIEQLYPLDRLDDATGSVCLGLVLRDGTTAWGEARPRGCR